MKKKVLTVIVVAVLVLVGTAQVNLVSLVTGVKGVLAPSHGGTGSSVAGVSGQVLRSNGTSYAPTDDIQDVTFNVDSPSPSDTGKFQHKVSTDRTAVELECDTDSGSASVNFELRSAGTPNQTSGVTLLSAPLSCGPTVNCNTFSGCTQVFLGGGLIPASTKLALVSTTDGSVTLLRVHLKLK